MRKKLIILLLSIAVVGALVYFAFNLISNRGKSDTELIEFGYKDVSKIDKFIITDPMNAKIEVVKKADGKWTTAQGDCIQQQNVDFILEAFKNIQFKGYLSKGEYDQQLKRMASKNIKVEIFENGEWSKTWYIGNATMDHYGQVMLLDSKEYGKSDYPVIMKMKNLSGFIEPRFYADIRQWMCVDILSIPANDIKKVEVKFTEEKPRSFSVEDIGDDYVVKQEGKVLENVEQAMVLRYLNNFKDINFSSANYILNKEQVDSVKQSQPFCVLSITQNSGKTSKLRMFTMPSEDESVNEFGNVITSNTGNFWCEIPNGELVKCQYFHFDPILRGHVYFPMDLSSLMNEASNENK